MTKRAAGLALVLGIVVAQVAEGAQDTPTIPGDLQRTYGAFATAMVDGDAERAIEFYAEDAVVLVDHEHVYRGRQAIRDGFLADYLEIASQANEEEPGTEIGVDRVVVGEGVVTLAGRYTNPSGAAGVYSNTWERQPDDRWKLAASVLTFESPDRPSAPSASGFACTQVLGFSQSMEWYAGLTLADYTGENVRPDLSVLDPDAYLPRWQGRFFMGAAVEKWRDPDFPGWSGAHRLAHETPDNCGRDEVDRVVFNVSGAARSPHAWAAAVDSVAALIRAKFPAVREIMMQPVVGAPEDKCDDVRAARNHPVVVEGIQLAADRGEITAGPSPKVASCDQFSDALGHLTVKGAEHVRRALREHYRPPNVKTDHPAMDGTVPGVAPRSTRDTAFIERSSESFGTFADVSFVRYTGVFRGETTLGAFRVPYEIVAPENPGLGNGTVLVEPPHFSAGTGGRDGVLGPELLFGDGYSYASVGFGENGRNILDPTASDLRLAGEPVQAPGQLDPTGTLDEEILVEFVEALTSDPFAVETLGPVDRLYAYGVSQTAAVLLELRRAVAGTDRQRLFDFTLLHDAVWQPPLPDTAQFDLLRGEFEPLEGLGRVIFVESEGDLVVSSADQFRKAVGQPEYRVYEVAGAAHGRSEHNPLDHHAVARAMFVAGDKWTRTGVEPPASTLLGDAPAGQVDPVYEFETGIARDGDLNARGGVRLPDLHLGRARFIASDSTTRPPHVPPRFAFLYGSMVDLACEPAPGSDTDVPRFRVHDDYVGAFVRQVEELQRQGFLLEADAAELKERAGGSGVGKPGTCVGQMIPNPSPRNRIVPLGAGPHDPVRVTPEPRRLNFLSSPPSSGPGASFHPSGYRHLRSRTRHA